MNQNFVVQEQDFNYLQQFTTQLQQVEIETLYKVSRLQFAQYLALCIQKYPFLIQEDVVYTDKNYSNIRVIENDKTVIYEHKSLIKRLNLLLANAYINIKKEEVINVNNMPSNWHKEQARYRRRFVIAFPIAELSFTIVTYDQDETEFYEIELEWKSGNLNEYLQLVVNIFLQVTQSVNIFSHQLFKQVTTTLKQLNGTKPDYTLINKPISLSYNQLTVHKPLSLFKREGSYYISSKADGIRRFIYIYQEHVWLYYPPYDLAYLGTINDKSYHNTIMDAEVVDKQVWLFDCLWYKGKDIRNENYELRHGYLYSIIIADLSYAFAVKEIQQLQITKFFDQVTNFLNRELFVNDGLIFTSYGSYNDTAYKWKDANNLTIDFLVKNYTLMVYDTKNRQEIEFHGTIYHPLTDIEWPTTFKLTDGVYEWQYYNNKLQIRKARPDKFGPNTLKVALDVWNQIFRPLTLQDLQALNMKLVFRYHNRIKRKLYSSVIRANKHNLTLLDIGSGRGGDLDKWIGFQKVYAVEPNPEHIKELFKRYHFNSQSEYGNPPRITSGYELQVLPYQAQQYNEIVAQVGKHSVNVVSLMLSLSFIDPAQYQDIITTIDNALDINGYLIILTIDGNSVSQLEAKQLQLPGLSVLISEEQINIDIPGSIVQEQQEWKVKIDKILSMLQPSYNLKQYNITDGYEEENTAPLLSSEQILFSRLFSYLILQKHKHLNTLPIKTVSSNSLIVPSSITYPSVTYEPTFIAPKTPKITVNKYNIQEHLVNNVGQGHCFFYTIMTALGIPASDVVKFRQSLANILLRVDPAYPGYAIWETNNRLGYLPFVIMQLAGDTSFAVPYSMDKLANKIGQSNCMIGDEIFSLIPYVYSYNLLIIQGYQKPYHIVYQSDYTNKYNTIIVHYSNYHYQLLTVDKNTYTFNTEQLQTLLQQLDIKLNDTINNNFDIAQAYQNVIQSYALDELKNLQQLDPSDVVLIHLRKACRTLQSKEFKIQDCKFLAGNIMQEKQYILTAILNKLDNERKKVKLSTEWFNQWSSYYILVIDVLYQYTTSTVSDGNIYSLLLSTNHIDNVYQKLLVNMLQVRFNNHTVISLYDIYKSSIRVIKDVLPLNYYKFY